MRDFDSLIQKLSPQRLADYLRLNNWTEIESLYEGRVLQFLNPLKDDAIQLPFDKSFIDYNNAILRVLRKIALAENSTINGVFTKLANPSCDILKWRIADDSTLNGSISFNSMGANIEHIKDLISSTCQDILAPSSYHAKVYTKDVQEQISQYSFGQTEIGSYILNILCPLGYYQYQLFDPENENLPMSRKINLRLLENINSIQHSIEEGSSEANDIVSEGKISINFLSSLSNLYGENKDSDLTISAMWNPSVPLLMANPISTILLKTKCIDKVNQIIEDNTPAPLQDTEKNYVGKIINIGAEPEVDNREIFNIKVAVIAEEGRFANVQASLNYKDFFDIANQAFQTGSDIRVTGIFSSTPKLIRLSNASIIII